MIIFFIFFYFFWKLVLSILLSVLLIVIVLFWEDMEFGADNKFQMQALWMLVLSTFVEVVICSMQEPTIIITGSCQTMQTLNWQVLNQTSSMQLQREFSDAILQTLLWDLSPLSFQGFLFFKNISFLLSTLENLQTTPIMPYFWNCNFELDTTTKTLEIRFKIQKYSFMAVV